MIGEQFADPSEVCGAVISVRQKGDRISLWTKSASNEAIQARSPPHSPQLPPAHFIPFIPQPSPRMHGPLNRAQVNLGKQLKSFLDISGHIGFLARSTREPRTHPSRSFVPAPSPFPAAPRLCKQERALARAERVRLFALVQVHDDAIKLDRKAKDRYTV